MQIDPPEAGRRSEAEENARRDREHDGEEQDARIDGDRAQARHVFRLQRLNPAHAGGRHHDAEQAADRREEDALGQELLQQPAAARAQRRADRELFLTSEGAREQQVGDVGAGDQQDEADGAEQHQQRTADVADDLLVQRHDAERQAAIGRIDVRKVAPQPGGDGVHLGLRGGGAGAGLELGENVVVLAGADGGSVRRERQRQEDLAVLGDPKRRHHLARQRESFGQHADDLERLSVERHRPSDDRWILPITPRPGAVVEDRRSRPARCVVSGFEEPAVQRPRAEHRQQVRGHADRPDAFRFAVASQVEVRAKRDRDVLESRMTRLDVEVLGRREPVFRDVESRRSVPEDREPVGILIGQRSEQQRTGDAEDRAVGADADRDRQDRDSSQPRGPQKRANGIAEVLEQRRHAGILAARKGGRSAAWVVGRGDAPVPSA